jgi:SOS-response transcriptional repressor LexA
MHNETRRANIKRLINERFAGNATAFGVAIKRSQSQVSQWQSDFRSIGEKLARDIEQKLGLPPKWLDEEASTPALPHHANTAPAPRLYRYPLISTVQAGQWAAIVDTFAPGDADEWPESPKRAGKHAFWLKIEGDSMEPRFMQGGMVLVDPDASADAGAFVVAKLVDSQEATFKKLATDAGRWYLVPLNKQYDAIVIDDPALRVIGRVVFYQPQGEVL